jgi:hypothetical protein
MKFTALTALAVVLSTPAFAQESNSNAGSTSGADSASTSGSASKQTQGQAQGQSLDGNVGNSAATSGSNSGASASTSSNSASNQSSTVGQANGQTVSTTFNSYPLKVTKAYTNAAVPLAASSSFSSDFCGSTVSGGTSLAPFGVSVSASATKYDATCRALRVAEKAGMLAVSANNMGFKDLSSRLTALATWSVCTSNGVNTADACMKLGLTGLQPPVNQAADAAEVTPAQTAKASADAATGASPAPNPNDKAPEVASTRSH